MTGTGKIVVAALLAGCAAPATQIVETAELSEAGGAPVIASVADLGGADVPAIGRLRPASGDGIAVIGEALWIRGRAFGRQPTVQIGGRPAAVLSRTGDGGILVRVPIGTPAGAQALTVTQERGSAEARLEVRRYAALVPPQGGRIAWVSLAPDGPQAAGGLELPGVRYLRLSADGRAGYALGAGRLTVIELPAPGGPAVAGGLELGEGRVIALSTAAGTHLAAVVRQDDVVLIDISSPLRPVRRASRALPEALRGPRAAELAPGGRYLAVALAQGNRVALMAVDRLGRPDALLTEVAVAPETRTPAIVDLAFSPDGRTLWVALGAPETRVVAVRLRDDGGPLTLEPARTVAVAAATAPARLSTGRSLPLTSGAAVRLPPERATVYFSAGVRGEGRAAVFRIGAEDAASELLGSAGSIGGIDVTPDGRWLLAAAVGPQGLRLLTAPADARPGASAVVDLGPARPDAVLADVRVQP